MSNSHESKKTAINKLTPKYINRPYRPSLEQQRKELMIPTLTDIVDVQEINDDDYLKHSPHQV